MDPIRSNRKVARSIWSLPPRAAAVPLLPNGPLQTLAVTLQDVLLHAALPPRHSAPTLAASRQSREEEQLIAPRAELSRENRAHARDYSIPPTRRHFAELLCEGSLPPDAMCIWPAVRYF